MCIRDRDNKTLKEFKNKVNTNNLIITKADKSQASVTVSYTHLDVYKRQHSN